MGLEFSLRCLCCSSLDYGMETEIHPHPSSPTHSYLWPLKNYPIYSLSKKKTLFISEGQQKKKILHIKKKGYVKQQS